MAAANFTTLTQLPDVELTPKALLLLLTFYCSPTLSHCDPDGEWKKELAELYKVGLVQLKEGPRMDMHEPSDKGMTHVEALCKEPLPKAGIIWRSGREVEKLLNEIEKSLQQPKGN